MKVLVDLGLIAAIFIAAAVVNMVIIGGLVCEISAKKHQVKSLELENADLRVKFRGKEQLRLMTLCCDVSRKEIIECPLPELLRKTIVNELADQMHEYIEKYMIAEDKYTEDTVKYYCDVWVIKE